MPQTVPCEADIRLDKPPGQYGQTGSPRQTGEGFFRLGGYVMIDPWYIPDSRTNVSCLSDFNGGNGMNPADPAIFQPDLDSPRVKGGAGEDVFDDSFGKLPGSLVLFQNYRDCKSGMDILSVLSFHNYFLLSLSIGSAGFSGLITLLSTEQTRLYLSAIFMRFIKVSLFPAVLRLWPLSRYNSFSGFRPRKYFAPCPLKC
jgi:hypothetical protein